MAAPPTVLGLTPARGGSKGVPRKNARPVLGKPLIAYTLETARTCGLIHRLIVSTDDEEIAALARRFGGETPFMRPAAIAQDDTPDLPVFQHALEWLWDHEGWRPDIVLNLRPTFPLRTAAHIGRVIERLWNGPGDDAVRTVHATPHHPWWTYRLNADGRREPFVPGADEAAAPRRQDLPPAYVLDGCVDGMRPGLVLSGSLYGPGDKVGLVVVDDVPLIDLDTEFDFQFLEFLLGQRLTTGP